MVIDFLLKNKTDQQLYALISIIWNHVFRLIGDHITENYDKIIFNLGLLHEFYVGPDFSGYISSLFSCQRPTVAHRAVVVQLSNQVFEEFLTHLLSMVQQDHERSEITLKVEDMSDEGRSKVRYVGGWAIFKILTVEDM